MSQKLLLSAIVVEFPPTGFVKLTSDCVHSDNSGTNILMSVGSTCTVHVNVQTSSVSWVMSVEKVLLQ